MTSTRASHFDVLVIGSGAAGLYAALCLPDHYRVGLITKDSLKTGASDWAQGGIAAALAQNDSPELHYQDTLKAGAGLCEPAAVDFLVHHAGEAIASLVNFGVAFDRHHEKLAMTLEAAHSRPRVLHAADTTGRAIVATLTEQVLARPNIHILSQAFVLNLWLNPEQGNCQGVSLLYQQKILWLTAAAVILATGGGGQVFAQTTNPPGSTGDGVALAWRCGALVRDLEFVQFHPTALTKPGAPRFLISEAVRGEGAHLIDHNGDRFVFAYHPAGELAPRDVVSRAIFNHLAKLSPDPSQAQVYLDLRPIASEQIRYRFPNIMQVCQSWGIDVLHEPIPVAPAAHYWMGGVATDLNSQTSIPGLYAIGETASTGVHGANRLASNSLLECIVFAAQLSQLSVSPTAVELSLVTESLTADWTELITPISTLREQLPKLMWQRAGISRVGESLAAGLAELESWREKLLQSPLNYYLVNLDPGHQINLPSQQAEAQLRLYGETCNLVDIARLILKSALFRSESRGGHYRSDYPDTLPQWQGHTLIQEENIWLG